MPIEIERKFLVAGDDWRKAVVRREHLRQGYLSSGARGVVRIRRSDDGATLTVKSPRRGLVRSEFEYPVPPEHADEMLQLCEGVLDKVRYWVEHADRIWHVDEYRGDAAGLVVAEIELDDPSEAFVPPPWLGREVSGDARYSNSAMCRQPTRNGAGARRPVALAAG